MIDLARVVRTTSFEAGSSAINLPKPFMIVFSAFHRVHRIWRWYKKGKIYSNPSNFVALAGGHAVNYLAGDKTLVRISALAVLIAHRITMVIDQVFLLKECYRKLQNSFKDEYSKTIRYELIINSKLSPSTASEAKYRLRKNIEKIKRIFICLFSVLKESFVLSMRMIDAIEMFYMSPETRNEGINEVFVNGTQILDTFEANRRELQKSLKNSKPIIEKVLRAINSSFTADQFIQYSSDAINNATDVNQAVKKITSPAGMVIQEIGKRALFGVASMFGFKNLIPKKLYPNFSCKPRNVDPFYRFAPIGFITLKRLKK